MTESISQTQKSQERGSGSRSGPGSAERILCVLESFLPTDADLSLAEISGRLSMTKSSVHRTLSTLTAHGFVEQDSTTRRYRLGMRLFEVGSAAVHQRGLHGAAHPALVELAKITGETCHLAVLSGTEAVYVYKIDGVSNFSMSSRVGGRAPSYCTGIGKVLLAWAGDALFDRVVKEGLRTFTDRTITSARKLAEELETVRSSGYAVDDAEYQEGLRCVAAPVRDHAGSVVAAIGIAGPTHRTADRRFESLTQLVEKAGHSVSRNLGYVGESRQVRLIRSTH
jgi:IclR family transcriptional regulator, KDG regulon repressor